MSKKILVLSSKSPFKVCDGSTIRTMQMVRMLAHKFGKVDLAFTYHIPSDIASYSHADCNEIFEFVRPRWKMALRAICGLFSSKPIQCNFFYSPNLARFIKEHIDEYDFVFCNNIRTAPYVENLNCRKVIDYVDAISMNYKGTAKKANLLWHFIYWWESKKVGRYEQKVLKCFDKHLIISDADKQYILKPLLGDKKFVPEINVITNYSAYDEELVEVSTSSNIVFVGSMFYVPNIVATKIFVKHIFPLILRQVPDAKFYIVGSKPAKAVYELASKNVIVTGFVKDPKDYLRKASVVVVPMYSGAGVQNKILEAMSIGCTVVTTKIGSEGLNDIVDGKHLFIRTGYDEMANTIVNLMRNNDLRESIGKNAKQYICDNLRFEHIYELFDQVFKDW